MRQEEIEFATERLKELERDERLCSASLNMLKSWWKQKMRMEKKKVVSIYEYRRRKNR